MKIEPAWLDLIPSFDEREFVSEVFAHDLQVGTLQPVEVGLRFALSPASSRWVSAIATLYGTSREDVIERCIQQAQFVSDLCPWALLPGVHYVEAILNSSRLRSRAASCREKCEVLASQLRYLSGPSSATLTGESAPLNSPPQPVSDALAHDWLLDRVSEGLKLLSPDGSEVGLGEESMAPVECLQTVAGDLVHYLYSTAIGRNAHPQTLLGHFVASAKYLDSNFPDLKVPSLAENFALKALQARKLALELNRILSGLETALVDWSYQQKRFAELHAYKASLLPLKP